MNCEITAISCEINFENHSLKLRFLRLVYVFNENIFEINVKHITFVTKRSIYDIQKEDIQ